MSWEKSNDPAYYLTIFTLDNHKTYRIFIGNYKGAFNTEVVTKAKGKIVSKRTFRLDKLTGLLEEKS